MIPLITTNNQKELFLEKLKARGRMDTGAYVEATKTIVEAIRKRGDDALVEYTQKWDHPDITKDSLRIPKEAMKEAYDTLEPKLKEAMTKAYERLYAFHEKQKQETWMTIKEGEILGQRVLPIASAGVYVPGGKASYPSSVLMNVVPAKVAGVKKIVMVTPVSLATNKEGKVPQNVLAAAYIAGVSEVYTIGGAQAIAALAFGTQTIPKVDKIVGPGNIYVALAKREVYGYVSIDSIAGPSEILVIADESANPTYVAADLLSQAEHDELASSILVTPSQTLAKQVQQEVTRLYEELPRQDLLKQSLTQYSAIVVEDTLKDCMALSNQIAPEHLELAVSNPFELLDSIENAGAIFMGHYTPEPIGDYMAGPNHVLPTSGTARFFSPLSVDDFVKKSSLLYFSQEALAKLSDETIVFAESEALYAHALAIKVRQGK